MNKNSKIERQEKVFPGADENTPSRSEYFAWINSTNEGPTAELTLANLEFFKWLHDEYGMTLDIYAFDAGALDGKRFYGKMNSPRFKKQFPKGFKPIVDAAKKMNTRIGIWGGPDGFGDTEEEAQERIETMSGLCRDFNFALFKFDAVCGPLRPEKEDFFIKMMKKCRKYSPDLILLNHRLGLKKGLTYATTFLWGGEETYVDVFSVNKTTAPHHRAGAISRGLVPGLKRLTEDHGVCISSCIDAWDDDLILQAFNRNLIVSPQIYGNPWLMRDDEFPKLARIFNLHRKYRNILVNGMTLPEKEYGKHAVSRGNSKQRFITLRNLSWNDAEYTISLDSSIGLAKGGKVELRSFHPRESVIGNFKYGEKVKVKVCPFRTALFYAGTVPCYEPAIIGADYQVIRSTDGKSLEIEVMGLPGTEAEIAILSAKKYKSAKLDGKDVSAILNGKSMKVRFEGEKYKTVSHYKLRPFDKLKQVVPEDIDSWAYEAAVFAADSNALEVRSLMRSGETEIPAVKKARNAFFEQPAFKMRGIWDRNLFDGDPSTGFWKSTKYNIDQSVDGGCFRLDLGEETDVGTITIDTGDEASLEPLLREEGNFAAVSLDLRRWKRILFLSGTKMEIEVNGRMRYLKLDYSPRKIVEVKAFRKSKELPRTLWRASNLFAHSKRIHRVWHTHVTPEDFVPGSKICVALNGKHGVEGAYVTMLVDGVPMGCPDRAPSFPSNTWEFVNAKTDSNYTYYFPMKEEFRNKCIEIFVTGYDVENLDFEPEAYMTCAPNDPFVRKKLTIS